MKAVAAALFAVLVLALSGCGPFSDAELKRQADTVSSTAAEGVLLADQVADNRTRESFVRVTASDLLEEMDHTQAKLHETEAEGEVPDDLLDPVHRTAELAANAADALQTLEFNPGDEAQARSVSEKLSDVSDSADQLSEGL